MQGNDLSNLTPPLALVHHSCFLSKREQKGLFRQRVSWDPDMLALNWFWRHSLELGVTLRALRFSGELFPTLEDLLFNPFSGEEVFPSRHDLARNAAFRPDIVAIFDTESTGSYGHLSRTLDKGTWRAI